MMKSFFTGIVLLSLTAQAQITNREVETQLNMQEGLITRTIEMALALNPGIQLKPVTDTSGKTQYIARISTTNLRCNFILESTEKVIADWAEITTLSGWKGNQLNVEETRDGSINVVQTASIKLKNSDTVPSKELELKCSKKIGVDISASKRCDRGYDESLDAKGIKLCKDRIERISYEELIAELASAQIILNINKTLKHQYKVITVQAKEVPAG